MQLEELEARVNRSRNFAAGVAVLVVAIYMVRFFWLEDMALSKDTATWGQLGDYLGGVLNPLLAYLAFYWLTQSVLLQKEELADTKKALRDSADAQLKQERHARKTAQINALSTLLASHNNDISNLRSNMEFVSSQLHTGHAVFTPQGVRMSPRDAEELLREMGAGLQSALQRRLAAMDEVTSLLRQNDV